jgi:trans-2-enoyl-CoA reductase
LNELSDFYQKNSIDAIVTEPYLGSSKIKYFDENKIKKELGFLEELYFQAFKEFKKILKPDGVIVTYGAMSRKPLLIPAGPLIFQNLSFKGFWISDWYNKTSPNSPERTEMLEHILTWYSEGRLKPVKSFHIDLLFDFEGSKEKKAGESEIKEFIKGFCEVNLLLNKGKCILRFI